jgi:hypothetical protein
MSDDRSVVCINGILLPQDFSRTFEVEGKNVIVFIKKKKRIISHWQRKNSSVDLID